MTTIDNTLQTKSISQYLKELPKSTLNKLYKHPSSCLAVFRFQIYTCISNNINIHIYQITKDLHTLN